MSTDTGASKERKQAESMNTVRSEKPKTKTKSPKKGDDGNEKKMQSGTFCANTTHNTKVLGSVLGSH